MSWVIAIIVCGVIGLLVGTLFSGASHVSGNISGTAKRRAERRMFWRGFMLPYALLGAVVLIKLCLWTRAKWHVMEYGQISLAWALVGLVVVGAVVGWVKRGAVYALLFPPPAEFIHTPVVPHATTGPLGVAGQLEAAGLRLVKCTRCGWQYAIPPSSGVWCPVCQDQGEHQWVPVVQPQEVGQ